MNYKRTSSVIFSLVCLSGFVFQVHQVSDLYFHFYTTSKTVFQVRETDYYQTIMYCPKSVDLLNRSSYKNYSIGKQPPQNPADMFKELNSLNIRAIFQLTPPESDVIESCVVRHGRLATPLIMNRSDCNSFFKVIKSVNGVRVCYTFMPRMLTNYSIGDLSSSEGYTNVIYYIFFNRSIAGTKEASFISSVMDPHANKFDHDLHSRTYQAKVVNFKTFNISCLYISGESTDINRLPAPHDTKCTPGHDREICYESCLQKGFKQINRLPWSGFYTQAIDIKMLTALDLRNRTILKFAEQSFERCHSLCKLKVECLTKFSRTTVQDFRSHYYLSLFASMLPSFPHISLYTVPHLTLIEYVVQVGSCFGIWFGLSIVSLNPIKILQSTDSTSRLVNNRNRKPLFILCKKVKQNEMQYH